MALQAGHDDTPSPEEIDDPGQQERPTGRSVSARSAILAIGLAALLCVLFAGDSIERTGEEMPDGFLRDLVTTVGKPTGAIARALPFAAAADGIAGWFGAEDEPAPRAAAPAPRTAGDGTAAADDAPGGGPADAITEAEFDRRTVESTTPRAPLTSLLVTGDSMSQPLDVRLARSLAPKGVEVVRDPHLGSGISKTFPVDWTQLAAEQIAEHPSEVVVMLLGANEGFPLPRPGGRPDAECCTAAWAAAYATRARAVARAYLDGGARQVLWLALPAPQDPRRQPISRAVNGAVRVALGGFGARATVLATDALFTPGGTYRGAMTVDGREQLVRDPDGIHLSEQGAELAAREVERELAALYRLP